MGSVNAVTRRHTPSLDAIAARTAHAANVAPHGALHLVGSAGARSPAYTGFTGFTGFTGRTMTIGP
ncbi:hypothetical protein ACW69C_01445 [Streptomyces sp. MN3]